LPLGSVATLGQTETRLFPADRAIIRHQAPLHATADPKSPYITVHKDGHTFGIQKQTPAGQSDHKSQFYANLENGALITVKSKTTNNNTPAAVFTYTTTSGLLCSIGTDGMIRMDQVAGTAVTSPNTMNDERCRILKVRGIVGFPASYHC